MYKIISLMIVVLFFLGCSTKVNKYAKPSDILHEQALTSTQKLVIKKDGITKAYVTVTHLNQIKQNVIEIDDETESFLVSVYIPTEDKKRDFYDIASVKVNGVLETCITPLKNDNPILKIIPFVNPWSTYLLLETLKQRDVRGVALEIEIDGIGGVKLSFYDSYGNLPKGVKGAISF